MLKKGTDVEVGETANLAQHNYPMAMIMLTIHPVSPPKPQGTRPPAPPEFSLMGKSW